MSNEPVDPVDLTPTRAELIARVRRRGRQIRTRRRIGIASLAAAIVVLIAVPAIAIGAQSSSRSVPPATVAPIAHDFRIAVVTSKPPISGSCRGYRFRETCFVLGRDIVTARGVTAVAVVHEIGTWAVDVTIAPAARQRLRGRFEAVIVVDGKILSDGVATVYENGGPVIPLTPDRGTPPSPQFQKPLPPKPMTHAEATALATKILGHAPGTGPASNLPLSARMELPGRVFVAGSTVKGTLVVQNPTHDAIQLELSTGCQTQWQVALQSAHVEGLRRSVPPCSSARTVFEPGTTRLPFTLRAAYAQCANPGETVYPSVPPCTHGRPPPLPAGEYHAVVTAYGQANFPFPTPPAVTVRVVTAR